MNIFPFYIGTRGVAAKPSVYRCLADFDSGTFTTLYSVKGLSSPTYLAASENDCLYAVGKSPDGDCVYALRESLSMASAPCPVQAKVPRTFLWTAGGNFWSAPIMGVEASASIHWRQTEGSLRSATAGSTPESALMLRTASKVLTPISPPSIRSGMKFWYAIWAWIWSMSTPWTAKKRD